MNKNIIITKLPSKLGKDIKTKYAKCPFCGSDDCIYSEHIYKTKNNNGREESIFSILKFWTNEKTWKIDMWSCVECGAEWESEPYIYDDLNVNIEISEDNNMEDELDKYLSELEKIGIISGWEDLKNVYDKVKKKRKEIDNNDSNNFLEDYNPDKI